MSHREPPSDESLPPLPEALHDELLSILFGDRSSRSEALARLRQLHPAHGVAIDAHVVFHDAQKSSEPRPLPRVIPRQRTRARVRIAIAAGVLAVLAIVGGLVALVVRS